jgi:hypothetical protein
MGLVVGATPQEREQKINNKEEEERSPGKERDLGRGKKKRNKKERDVT